MGITRNLIFLIDPYKRQGELSIGQATTISFAAVPDANDAQKAFTCAHVPISRGVGISVSQESFFLGTTAAAGLTIQTLKRGVSMDGSDPITYEFITSRIDPDWRPDSQQAKRATEKRYDNIEFNGPSLLDFNDDLYWTLDCNPVEDNTVVWKQFNYEDGATSVYFESGLARWIHLKGTGSSMSSDEIILSGFTARYREVGRGAKGGN